MADATETTHRATVRWDADRRDLRAHTVAISGQTVAGSSSPRFEGDPKKADPEEMFVAAIASCHMLWFLRLARESRVRVTAYEDAAEGRVGDTKFTAVVLRPCATFDREVDTTTIAAWHRQAHERCFIANSVTCPVEVRPRVAPPGA